MSTRQLQRALELDPTNYPAFRDRILAAERDGIGHELRTYPGYPRVALDRVRPRRWVGLDATLERRRSARTLGTSPLSRKHLSRLLQYSHGVTGDQGRGPAPSAGGLQAIELYLVAFDSAPWLAEGAYHYDRAGHALAQVVPTARRGLWLELLPSARQFDGGSMLFVLVGDRARVESKYGDRALRFLLLEAGHVMQNLCIVAASLDVSILPLGGFFEASVAATLVLPASDAVLYVGIAG